VPIEELLFNNSLSSNRKVIYVDKGFHRLRLVNRTNRKVFRLILCVPVKTIANKHELWMLRAIKNVEISDSLDVRPAFAPSRARSRDICLAYQGLLRAIYCRDATVLNPAVSGPEKRPLS
jgi:hypothetical protein